jgi:hypothetical protein
VGLARGHDAHAATPDAHVQCALLLERLVGGEPRALLGPNGRGRVALLAQASRREPRRERIRDFFAKHGVSSRSLASIDELFEELVTNALYDAPVEAGYFSRAVARTEDIELPHERACEISYGIDQTSAFMRVRDTFGALTRQRLIDVLHRCNARSVGLDESRGGAGLGLWRVFAIASSITINVVPGSMTDILVALRIHEGKVSKELVATHLFFAPPAPSAFPSVFPEDGSYLDDSIARRLRTDRRHETSARRRDGCGSRRGSGKSPQAAQRTEDVYSKPSTHRRPGVYFAALRPNANRSDHCRTSHVMRIAATLLSISGACATTPGAITRRSTGRARVFTADYARYRARPQSSQHHGELLTANAARSRGPSSVSQRWTSLCIECRSSGAQISG